METNRCNFRKLSSSQATSCRPRPKLQLKPSHKGENKSVYVCVLVSLFDMYERAERRLSGWSHIEHPYQTVCMYFKCDFIKAVNVIMYTFRCSKLYL